MSITTIYAKRIEGIFFGRTVWNLNRLASTEKISFMFKNYFRVATRILARNKLYTIINVLGLAIGACGCIVIWLVGSYELSFDRFHPDVDRIYRVVEGGKPGGWKSTSVLAPMAQAIRETVTGTEAVTEYYDEYGMREVKVPAAGKPTATFPCTMEGEDQETGVIIAD